MGPIILPGVLIKLSTRARALEAYSAYRSLKMGACSQRRRGGTESDDE